jgi:hypothetical protein
MMPEDSPYEVYLVDPGARASHVITLVQEVTHRTTPECAELVHDAPSRIASFANRQAAEDLAARFREFDAVAMVRRPGDKSPSAAPPAGVALPPRLLVGVGLLILGFLQLVVAIGWMVQTGAPGRRPEIPALGELALGIVAIVAGIWKLRTRELD